MSTPATTATVIPGLGVRAGGATSSLQVLREIVREAFFGLAADLITLAADMLGYTELPLPGIGHLLKGAKAVMKKLPKVVEALEKAEKVYEELEKIKDAKEKLDKAKELKDALDGAKKAMEGAK